jgi:hypothetical protein
MLGRSDFLFMLHAYIPRRYVYLGDYLAFGFISFYFTFRKIAKSDY